MFTPLTIVLLTIVLIILFLFLFYRKLYYITFSTMSLLFFVGLTLALTSIFIPKTFEVITEFAFEETGFAKELKTTDEVLTTVSETSDSIKDSIGKIFGQKDSEDKKVEVNLYDDFIKFLAEILRWTTFVLAILVMILSTYLRYAFASVYDVKELRKRVERLENKSN